MRELGYGLRHRQTQKNYRYVSYVICNTVSAQGLNKMKPGVSASAAWQAISSGFYSVATDPVSKDPRQSTVSLPILYLDSNWSSMMRSVQLLVAHKSQYHKSTFKLW